MKDFPKKLDEAVEAKDEVFKQLLNKEYIGVVCGSLFSEELIQKSMENNLIAIHPGGSRYKVEIPHNSHNWVNKFNYLDFPLLIPILSRLPGTGVSQC